MSDYKIVNLQYTEQASILVRAKSDDEAEEAVYEEFPSIPDLQIISIEEAPDDAVEKVLAIREEREKKRTLN